MNKLIILLFFSFLIFSCAKDDPCDLANSIQCPTGDFDDDGTLNGDDEFPEDFCLPKAPSIEINLIGTWNWKVSNSTGIVKINRDGTYENIENKLIKGGLDRINIWYIENKLLVFEIDDCDLVLEWVPDYSCNMIDFYFYNSSFNRVL